MSDHTSHNSSEPSSDPVENVVSAMPVVLPVPGIGVEFDVPANGLAIPLNHATAEVRPRPGIPHAEIGDGDPLPFRGLKRVTQRPGEPQALPIEL